MTREQAIDELSSLYDWLRRAADHVRAGIDLDYEPTPEDYELWAEALADLAYPRVN